MATTHHDRVDEIIRLIDQALADHERSRHRPARPALPAPAAR
jgi:hypothetical protein